jgi:hypothetical protein
LGKAKSSLDGHALIFLSLALIPLYAAYSLAFAQAIEDGEIYDLFGDHKNIHFLFPVYKLGIVSFGLGLLLGSPPLLNFLLLLVTLLF